MAKRLSDGVVWQLVMLLCLVLSPSLVAGGGTSSGEFLKVSAYSRGMAMGGAWAAVAEGTGALYYNPAGVGRKGVGELSVSHSELLQDLKLENVSLTCPLANGSGLGLGVSYLGYGSIDGYDISGDATGNVSAYSLLIVVGFSQRLSNNVSLGVAVKPAFERLGEFSAHTVTTDIGLIADAGQFSIGAQLANWGGSLKLIDDKIDLPTTLRAGIAYRTPGTNSIISLGGSRDADGVYALTSGIEYHYSRGLTLRTGYSSTFQNQTNATDGFSFGAGLLVQSIDVDYSYRPSGSLDGIHQVTVSYQFGR